MGINCKTAVDFVSKKEEGKLTIVQRYQLWYHLAICYLCKRFYQQNNIIIKGIKHHAKSTTNKQLNKEEKDIIINVLKDNC